MHSSNSGYILSGQNFLPLSVNNTFLSIYIFVFLTFVVVKGDICI